MLEPCVCTVRVCAFQAASPGDPLQFSVVLKCQRELTVRLRAGVSVGDWLLEVSHEADCGPVYPGCALSRQRHST